MKERVEDHGIKVILASESPRRQEMLQSLSIDFQVCIPRISEKWNPGENPRKVATRLAVEKAQKCRKRTALIVGMDTLVVANRDILGKPTNAQQAKAMLQLLSGRTHQVITGVALIWKGAISSGAAVTHVEFRRIHPGEIDWYVETGEPFDKAGAYAIQGLARIFIQRIDGCYYNVVGFPLTLFQRLLKRLGFSILDLQTQRNT
ncbi:MAG: Maf family protein [Acidobacteriota bacterium]